jgi:hypothetical protein
MADFLAPNEGKTELANNGLPTTCTFNLSTKTVEEVGASATYAGGFGVATGTGYSSKTEAEPTASSGKVEFAKKTWETGSATDWPASVKSCWLSNGTSKLICGWNLQAGGTGRDLSKANTTENFTPTLQVG